MNDANSYHEPGRRASVTAARPVVLVRYRPGLIGEAARVVHLIPLPTNQAGAVTALCGALLRPEDIDMVTPGEGMPCTLCALHHISSLPPPGPADPTSAALEPAATAADYQAWEWPVTQHHDQIRLSLGDDAVALIIPAMLATEVIEILSARHSPSPVLAHPYAPAHRVLLGGEPYPVALPWPPGVHRVTGTLLLPPTVTPRGPLTWIHPPEPDALRLCREIDILGALRTALPHLESLSMPSTTDPTRQVVDRLWTSRYPAQATHSVPHRDVALSHHPGVPNDQALE